MQNYQYLKHYLHHFLIACLGLLVTYFFFGTITIWEIFLFFFMSFIPFLDELFHTALNYLSSSTSRNIINLFLVGDFFSTLYLLHKKRLLIKCLTAHNLLFHLSVWLLWFYAYLFEEALLFYIISAIQIHLIFDILNDMYEFASIRKWLWPIFNFSHQE